MLKSWLLLECSVLLWDSFRPKSVKNWVTFWLFDDESQTVRNHHSLEIISSIDVPLLHAWNWASLRWLHEPEASNKLRASLPSSLNIDERIQVLAQATPHQSLLSYLQNMPTELLTDRELWQLIKLEIKKQQKGKQSKTQKHAKAFLLLCLVPKEDAKCRCISPRTQPWSAGWVVHGSFEQQTRVPILFSLAEHVLLRNAERKEMQPGISSAQVLF